jgi:hypothetical protein
MSTTHVGRWIKTLADVGLKPEMFEIESVLEWQEAEAFWIKYFRSIGAQLCNTAPGGGWYPGCQHAVETLKKREATAKSRGVSDKQRAANRLLRKRLEEDPEFYAHWRANQQAAIKSQEYRDRMSAAVRGRKMPRDAVERTRQAHIGRRNTPEQLARISAVAREREARRKIRESETGRKYVMTQEHRANIARAARARANGQH